MPVRTEVVQKAHEALNVGDLETLVSLCDPAVRLDMSDRVLNPAVYDGHEGIRRFYAEVMEVWESFTWDPTALSEIGELVVVEIHSRGKGRASGLALDRHAAMVWRVGEEKVLSITFFRDPERAHAIARSHSA
jgi:ketosteroid isomerase-like protein